MSNDPVIDDVESELGDEGDVLDESEVAQEFIIDNNPNAAPDEDMETDNEGDDGQGDDDGDAAMEADEKDDSAQGFFGHTDSVFSIALNPTQPNLVLSGGGDDRAFIWDAKSGESLYELKGHADSVTSVGFSMDGRLAATASLDGGVKVWDVTNGNLVQNLDGPAAAVEWLCWHSKGNILLAGSEDSCSYMWTAATGTLMGVFAGHGGGVNCGMFTPDGKKVVTGSIDHSVRVWNPKDQTTAAAFSGGLYHQAPINVLACRADNTLVIAGSEDNNVSLLNIVTNKVMGMLRGHQESVESVAFSPLQPFCYSGAVDGFLGIWDMHTLQSRSTCDHSGSAVTKIIPHPTKALVITGSGDGIVRVWDDRTAACVRRLSGHKDVLLDVALSADNSFVVSGSDDKTSLVFALDV